MTKVLYTTHASVRGGREAGQGRTDDGRLEVTLRSPQELGGDGDGTNPEQLFAIGYAACFESALRFTARRERIDVGDDVSVNSTVRLIINSRDGSWNIGVDLDVALPNIDDVEEAKRLVAATHRTCTYSNAIRGNVDVNLSVDGEPVPEEQPQDSPASTSA